MADFVMEFLDWFSEFWNNLIEQTWEVIKIAVTFGVVIFSAPLWLLPFLFWLVFVKLKGGEGDGD